MSRRQSTPILAVAVFTVVYLIAAIIGAMVTGSTEFLFYIGVMVVLIGAVLVVHRRVELSISTLWALSIWGLLHMAGGLLSVPESWPVNGESRVLYNWWIIADVIKYDHVVHTFGFGVTTWVCWQGIRSIVRRTGGSLTPTFGQMVLSWACGLGFGAVNEVIEFLAVLMMPETNVGGYINTGWDLVANLTGATVAAILIYFSNRP